MILMPRMGVRIARPVARAARMRGLIGVVCVVVPVRVVFRILALPIGAVVVTRVRGPLVPVRVMPVLRSRLVRVVPGGVAGVPSLGVRGVRAGRTVVTLVQWRASRVTGTCRMRAVCIVVTAGCRVIRMGRRPAGRRRMHVRGVTTARTHRAGRSLVIVPVAVTRRPGGTVGRPLVHGMVVLEFVGCRRHCLGGYRGATVRLVSLLLGARAGGRGDPREEDRSDLSNH